MGKDKVDKAPKEGKEKKDRKEKREKKEKKLKEREVEPASLSSFLLGGETTQLDDIFANSRGPAVALAPILAPTRRKKSKELPPPPSELDDVEDDMELPNDADLSSVEGDLSGLDEEELEDEAEVEEAYAARRAAEKLKKIAVNGKKKAVDSDDDSEEEEDDEQSAGDDEASEEDELDIERLMKDSILPRTLYKEVPASNAAQKGKTEKDSKAKEKKRREEESPEERDQRTVFIGNVPVACSTSKSLKKALLRHVLQSDALQSKLSDLAQSHSSAPIQPKAATIRFRSLAFASTVFGRKAEGTNAEGTEEKEEGGRGRKRAKEWRDNEDSDARGVRGGKHGQKDDEPPSTSKGKKALTDGQKRRVAFIRGDLNEGKKVCNAYIVLHPLQATIATAVSLEQVIKLVVETSNGTHFEGQTLRSDVVRPKSSAAIIAAAQMKARPDESTSAVAASAMYKVPPAEARRTVFLGGLDFAETEEEVRKAVQQCLVRERGDGEWVQGVRLIRDASSGLGKGFGYVLMADTTCVDHLLSLPPGQPLKVSKRKVRLERCKTGVAAARAKAATATAAALKAKSSIPSAILAAPKPPRLSNAATASAHQAKLADALAKLPPSERKAIKAEDPERLMRRAQKKKNKVLKERWERKQGLGKGKEGSASAVLGRETRGEERKRKEKKRVKEGNKTGKRAKKSYD